MPDFRPRASTYFSKLFGFAYLLAGLFALVFYLVCYLFSKGQIAAGDAAVLLATYWAASTLYFAKRIHGDFPRFYTATLRRMRRYSARRIFLQWYLGFTVVFILPLSFILVNYSTSVLLALSDWSIKFLIAGYGVSLFSVIFIATIICKVIAAFRGVATAGPISPKAPRKALR